MRILHTSDWHLGQTLHDYDRGFEHDAFLAWLLEQIVVERIDLLLIAGDLFDVANPPASAQERWYRFLARARTRIPALGIVAIGGNHDSASRLEAPSPILDALGVHLVGGLPRRSDGALDLDRLIVPFESASGERAWVAAVPFLRLSDVTAVGEAEARDPSEGVRAIYRAVLEAMKLRRSAGEPMIALGHLYAVGGQVSELSERKVLGGNQHAIAVEAFFSDEIAYVALGHLHLAQAVGGRDHVRYCGSPIPLALDEANYRHQVCIVEIEEGRVSTRRSLEIPRAVPIVRIPSVGAAPLDAVLIAVRALATCDDAADNALAIRPFVDLHVRLDQPEPLLREQLDAALAGKSARLCRVVRSVAPRVGDSAPVAPTKPLDGWTPEEVLRRRWALEYPNEAPSSALLAAFHELMQSVERA